MNPFLPSDLQWELDEFDVWNLRFTTSNGQEIHAFIQPRPAYCDRGHWVLNVEAHLGLDGADAFPRYFMSLERAKAETEDWLVWRLYKVPFEASQEARGNPE